MFPFASVATKRWAVPVIALMAAVLGSAGGAGRAAGPDAPLPPGVRVEWSPACAWRETTPTRERVSLNGLWRWQPAATENAAPPAERWGFFKVPGCWPGITDYMQKDSQQVFPHPDWRDQRLGGLTSAWYQREIVVPESWTGRRVSLHADCVNSLAAIYLDGRRVGEIRFPAGELDLTEHCKPGSRHLLSLRVTALPLRAVMLSYTDTSAPREVAGRVARRGLCGDVTLVSTPRGARIGDVRIEPSVSRGELTVDVALHDLPPSPSCVIQAEVLDGDRVARRFSSPPFAGSELRAGRLAFSDRWLAPRLWDLHTPGYQYDLRLSLLVGEAVADVAAPKRFGFREFRIVGKDFFLNGSRVWLSAVPLDNAQVGAALATYSGAKESLLRLKSFGINFVYTHNYGCEPGAHLGFEEILRAADDTGMLVALSQPHFGQYDWNAAEADRENGYAAHAAHYVRAAGNHPAVVCYSMSHNSTGYGEDMNPDLMAEQRDPRSPGEQNGARRALRAEAIVRGLDPGRIVYHHSSGNLGSMHTVNFYANFVPVQEMSDWFEPWSKAGTKPVFLCEYGVPFSWDWGMYRGWYDGQREFGSAAVPWDFSLAEWNAQFLGPAAYRITPREERNVRWEAGQFRAGRLWHRWDYPTAIGSGGFTERDPVFAEYLTRNWRSFRADGLSALSPWEYAIFWSPREGLNRSRRPLPVDWDHLQRPGFSPDYIDQQYERMDLAFGAEDWIPSEAGKALIRNNGPLLAFLGGGDRPSGRDHNYSPGDVVEKQLVLINNSRIPVAVEWEWSVGLPGGAGRGRVSIPTGEQVRVPIRLALAASTKPGSHRLRARVRFEPGGEQLDDLDLHVLPRPGTPKLSGRIVLFDPKGGTAALLREAGVRFRLVEARADPAGAELLVIGRGALEPGGAAPDLSAVRRGLKVVVFEQTASALEKRLGFRVVEYGLRRAFPRVPGHPILQGLSAAHLEDWRGEATLTPGKLEYTLPPRRGPTVEWCGIPVSRIWRRGCRGNVASVLIEKPARGDFLALIDGGFSLQYSPLLEYREGRGMVLFCQADVTGRTRRDPAAELLVRRILEYAAAWKPRPGRTIVYEGEPAGRQYLESAGGVLAAPGDEALRDGRLLVLGPGAPPLASRAARVREWLARGGALVALGLDSGTLNHYLPQAVQTRTAEHLASAFEAPEPSSPLAGVSPAEVHNRDPRPVPLVTGGATVVGDGVLAIQGDGRVLCQLTPWQFDQVKPPNVKRTFRRTACLLARILGNMDALSAAGCTPLLDRFGRPVQPGEALRCLDGLYLDRPEEWDYPYRFFRW